MSTMTIHERVAIEAALGNFKAIAEIAVKMYEHSVAHYGAQDVEISYDEEKGTFDVIEDYCQAPIAEGIHAVEVSRMMSSGGYIVITLSMGGEKLI